MNENLTKIKFVISAVLNNKHSGDLTDEIKNNEVFSSQAL